MPPAIFQAGGPKRDTPFAATAPLSTLPASMARLLSLNHANSNICSDRAPVSLLDPRFRCTPDHRSRFAYGRCMRTNAVYRHGPSDRQLSDSGAVELPALDLGLNVAIRRDGIIEAVCHKVVRQWLAVCIENLISSHPVKESANLAQ
jgi:hypothetical protein